MGIMYLKSTALLFFKLCFCLVFTHLFEIVYLWFRGDDFTDRTLLNSKAKVSVGCKSTKIMKVQARAFQTKNDKIICTITREIKVVVNSLF